MVLRGVVVGDVVGVGEDAHFHDLVQLRPDVLVGREVLIHRQRVVLVKVVLTRIQVVLLIGCVVGQVVTGASSIDFDRRDDVVGDHVAGTRGCIGVLQHSHDSVTLEVTLIHIPLLFLLRHHLVVIVIV